MENRRSALAAFRRRLWQKFLQSLRLLRDVVRFMREADMQIMASSLAFATMISFVPLLAVSLSVFTAYGGLEPLLFKIEAFVLDNVVEATSAAFETAIRKSVARAHSGVLGFWGIAGLLLSSTKLFHDIETAVQRVWQIKDHHFFAPKLLVYWLLMFAGPLLVAAALGVVGSKDVGLLEVLPHGLIALAFAFIGLFCVYKWVPACRVKTSAALISALTAAVSMGIAKSFYATVMVQMLRYSRLYGSLASVPIFLIWLFVLWWICLAGVALCAALQKGSVRS